MHVFICMALYCEQGYKQKDAYIATQGPLKNTVEDLWKMMWEYQCGCIMMLCQLMEDGQVYMLPYSMHLGVLL